MPEHGSRESWTPIRVWCFAERSSPPAVRLPLGIDYWLLVTDEDPPVRVIAGDLKGRRLHAPTWEGLRPTSDKLRETLFNVLGARVAGARVVDGYAGTGAVGIEALSRGAAHVTFIDHDPRAVRLIERNLQHCRITDRYVIIRARVADAAAREAAGTFDLVLLDPPYAREEAADALAAGSRLVAADGTVVLEHAKRDAAPEDAGDLKRVRTLTSGDSALSLYRADRERGA
jgi:16S rRNA (guanine966-N2)-methyltransferase